jgi:hypothetical protein
MATTQPGAPGGGALERQSESTLADVVTTILDKGLVIDVFARVSLVGIEVLRADVRVVVASVDTYLRFAEATNRLEMGAGEPEGLPEFMDDVQESGSKKKTKGALEAAGDKLEEFVSSDEDEREPEPRRSKERSR